MKKNKREHQTARATVFLLLMIYIIMSFSTWKNVPVSEIPRPAVKTVLNGDWEEAVENCLLKHIGFHDALFHLKSQTDLIMGEKMIQNVYITEDRLLEKQFCPEKLSAELINEFYQNDTVPTYLVLVPSASEIYESSLPANALNANQKDMIKLVYADTANGIRCVDAYHILTSLKDNYIYYRTDSHWTSYAAYYVYQSAIQKMGFTPVSYQRYVISHLSTEFRGDLYQKTLYDEIRPDVLDCYTYESGSQIRHVVACYQDGTKEKRKSLYDDSALVSDDMYRFYLGEPCEKLIIRTNLDNGKKLLLYKDDFADCMIPFLIQHYSEICVINLQQTGAAFQELARPSDYTQVMFLCSVMNWNEIFK